MYLIKNYNLIAKKSYIVFDFFNFGIILITGIQSNIGESGANPELSRNCEKLIYRTINFKSDPDLWIKKIA